MMPIMTLRFCIGQCLLLIAQITLAISAKAEDAMYFSTPVWWQMPQEQNRSSKSSVQFWLHTWNSSGKNNGELVFVCHANADVEPELSVFFPDDFSPKPKGHGRTPKDFSVYVNGAPVSATAEIDRLIFRVTPELESLLSFVWAKKENRIVIGWSGTGASSNISGSHGLIYSPTVSLAQVQTALTAKGQKPTAFIDVLNFCRRHRGLPRIGMRLHDVESVNRLETVRNQAESQFQRGGYREAAEAAELALSYARDDFGSGSGEYIESLGLLAKFRIHLGDIAAAKELYLEAVALSKETFGEFDHRTVANLDGLAVAHMALGDLETALSLQRKSYNILKDGGDAGTRQLAITAGNITHTLSRLQRSQEALTYAQEALTIWRQKDESGGLDLSIALSNLGNLYADLRQLDSAEALLSESASVLEKANLKAHPSYGQRLIDLGHISSKMGDDKQATRHFQAAREIFVKIFGERGVRTNVVNLALASALAAEGRCGEANSYFAATLLDQTGQELFIEGRVRDAAAVANAVLCAIKQDQDSSHNERDAAGRGFYLSQLDGISSAAGAVARMAARVSEADDRLAKSARRLDDLSLEIGNFDSTYSEFLRKDNRDFRLESELKIQADAARQELATIKNELRLNYPTFMEMILPKPTQAQDIQSILKPNEVLISFYYLPEFDLAYRWIVSTSGISLGFVKPGRLSLGNIVQAIRCGLDRVGGWRWAPSVARWKGSNTQCQQSRPEGLSKDDNLPFDLNLSFELYQRLLGDAVDLIKDKHLIIVPSGALTTLPFQVLITKQPKTESFADASWLIREHAITVLPSVSSLNALRRIAKRSRGDRLMIGFGNPLLDGNQQHLDYGKWFKKRAQLAREKISCGNATFEGATSLVSVHGGVTPVSTRGGLADLGQLKRQAPLPETADELCAVARDLGADMGGIRLGANATETELKQLSASGDLARYRILHFATHGALAGQLSGTTEPGLILTPPKSATEQDDGYLSSSEIASLKLDADWVILSACNTAGGSDEANAEALGGLARVFFYAGARALLVSHWEVYSDSTVKLITKAARTIADGSVGQAEALRRAMLDLIDNGKSHEAHPAYWAPFVVVGEGAAG